MCTRWSANPWPDVNGRGPVIMGPLLATTGSFLSSSLGMMRRGAKNDGGMLRFVYDAYLRSVIMVRQLQKITDQPLVGSRIPPNMSHPNQFGMINKNNEVRPCVILEWGISA